MLSNYVHYGNCIEKLGLEISCAHARNTVVLSLSTSCSWCYVVFCRLKILATFELSVEATDEHLCTLFMWLYYYKFIAYSSWLET